MSDTDTPAQPQPPALIFNEALAIKIRERIRAEPQNFEMESWFEGPEHGCGTTACIGGWAIIESAPPSAETRRWRWEDFEAAAIAIAPSMATVANGFMLYNNHIQSAAAKLLGISEDEAEILFNAGNWPRKFSFYGEMQGHDEATRAIALIDHLIALKKRGETLK